MKKVGICGHFGIGKMLLNGQTIKTQIVTAELKKQLGDDEVLIVDSHGGVKELPRMLLQLWKLFQNCETIIMMPAYKGLLVFSVVFYAYNLFFRRKLEYVVIGGWLNDFIEKHWLVAKFLKAYDGIFVETQSMKKVLEKKGYRNVFEMPNFKDLSILKKEELRYPTQKPYPLCTFSRVMKEKGIEEAVVAVCTVNAELKEPVYTLDIYGQIDPAQKEWFENLTNLFPDYVRYRSAVPYDQSVEILKSYFALLFPTYYEGEGFAGTLLDAMAAGLPVIASDWKYNSEIVIDGKNGKLIASPDRTALVETLKEIAQNPDQWLKMKETTIERAHQYRPENAIQVLLTRIK